MSYRKSCIDCGIPFPVKTQGYLAMEDREDVSEIVASAGFPVKFVNDIVYIPYETPGSLDRIVECLDKNGKGDINVSVTGQTGQFPSMIKLSILKERIRNNEIVELITKGSFVSFFQPIIELKNESVFGYESLLRSNSADISVPPGVLFETAHKTGLYSLLDQKARETAIKSRVGKLPNGVKSFINFLPSTIYNPAFCLQHTFSVVEKYNVVPEDLVFEVVETEEIADIDHLKNIFKTYKESGMKVALDDVGSGFATLDVLSKLKPDYIKIDREYISYCDQNTKKQDFLQQALYISKQMGIKVLGEGIERKEELEFCRSAGMDLAQGYFIGKPEKEPLSAVNTVN